jgi:hypothetical protein
MRTRLAGTPAFHCITNASPICRRRVAATRSPHRPPVRRSRIDSGAGGGVQSASHDRGGRRMDARRKAGWSFMAIALLACAPAFARAPNDAAAEAQLREVIRRFDAAIVAGDGATLRSLFLPQPSAWASVLGEAEYARLKARRPEAQRVRPDTYENFAKMAETAKLPQRERFTDIDIRTDGAMART